MKHQVGRKKLNVKSSHKRSLLRNQAMLLIEQGHLTSTKARVKEVRKLVERLVTIARKGKTFNQYRRAHMLLPYKKETLDKLFTDVAPRYTERPGGYTRIISLGKRPSDTASIARIEWV